jgi:hypothetical protein
LTKTLNVEINSSKSEYIECPICKELVEKTEFDFVENLCNQCNKKRNNNRGVINDTRDKKTD